MTSKQNDMTESLLYDERKKELKQIKSQVTENTTDEKKDKEGKVIEESKLISTVNHKMEVVYTEEGIKLAHSNLKKEKELIVKTLKDVNKTLENAETMPEDLKLLKEQLEKLSKFQAIEKAEKEKVAITERQKLVNKELDQLEKAIGGRLKL